MVRVRSGQGLGDALYLRAVAERMAREQETIALTDFPDVFLGSAVKTEPFTRLAPHTIAAHYTASMDNQDSTQYADMVRTAGLRDVPLRFTWNVRNAKVVTELAERADGRPIILVHGGCVAMQRKDNFSADMLPRREAFVAALDALNGDCYCVGIGKAARLYELPLDEDLHGMTTVSDLLDIAVSCTGILAQCSFCVPLAEVFDKPLLAVWAARGLTSSNSYIRGVTPAKVLSKPSSTFLMDDWSPERIADAARRLLSPEVACAS